MEILVLIVVYYQQCISILTSTTICFDPLPCWSSSWSCAPNPQRDFSSKEFSDFWWWQLRNAETWNFKFPNFCGYVYQSKSEKESVYRTEIPKVIRGWCLAFIPSHRLNVTSVSPSGLPTDVVEWISDINLLEGSDMKWTAIINFRDEPRNPLRDLICGVLLAILLAEYVTVTFNL